MCSSWELPCWIIVVTTDTPHSPSLVCLNAGEYYEYVYGEQRLTFEVFSPQFSPLNFYLSTYLFNF